MNAIVAAQKELEALEAIAAAARQIRAANPHMTTAQSQARALADQPELYTAYLEANRQLRAARGAR
jgi:hypothetical protein